MAFVFANPPVRRWTSKREPGAATVECLPFTGTHRNFRLLVGAGEFVEAEALIGNGALIAIMAKVTSAMDELC